MDYPKNNRKLYRKATLVLCGLLSIGMIVGLPVGSKTAVAVVPEAWEIAYTSTDPVILNGVSALNADTAWAVGHTGGDFKNNNEILRWDGISWNYDGAVPNPGINTNALQGVAAVSAPTYSAWAVGHYSNNEPLDAQTEILRRDQSGWTQVSSPNPGTGSNYLRGVAAHSADLAFAVGYYYDGQTGPYQTMILRWNGTQWQQNTTPNPGNQNFLQSVSIVSSNLAFAVGYYTIGSQYYTLVLKWDGISWSQEATPNPGTGTGYNILQGVVGVSNSYAWAVGYYGPPSQSRTLTLFWNGNTWAQVSSPNKNTNTNLLSSVAYATANDVFAVGRYNSPPNQTLIERWSDANWNIQSSPNVGTSSNYLRGVAAAPGFSSCGNKLVWAVGYYLGDFGVEYPMIQRYETACAYRPPPP